MKRHAIFYGLFIFFLLNVNAFAQQATIKIISPEPFIKEIHRTGKLGFKRTLDLSFKSSGYLANINVDEGDFFFKGQVLAELDIFELTAAKNSNYARLLQAKNDVSRIKALLKKKLSSRQALDNAIMLVETTRANFKLAQYNLEKSQLIAPYDGVVLTRFSEVAELQTPNKEALQIAAMNNNVVVRVALTAKEVALIKHNQAVEVNFSGNIVMGTISKIPLQSNPVSQLYPIEIFLADIDINEVTVGQVVKVNMSIDSNRYVYRLPIAALNTVNEKGEALITLQLNDKKRYQQKAFTIEQLSNNFIYLSTEQSALPLTVLMQGWQQLVSLIKVNGKLINTELKK
jgi:RND family efflux transporter MFP subunit